jgi:hypothetical protein
MQIPLLKLVVKLSGGARVINPHFEIPGQGGDRQTCHNKLIVLLPRHFNNCSNLNPPDYSDG